MPTRRRIFLAHAREDKPQVRKLYADLEAGGLDPWLHEIDLLPGADLEGRDQLTAAIGWLADRPGTPPMAAKVSSVEGIPDELPYGSLESLDLQVTKVDDEMWVEVNDHRVENASFGETPPWRDIIDRIQRGQNKILVGISNGQYGGLWGRVTLACRGEREILQNLVRANPTGTGGRNLCH